METVADIIREMRGYSHGMPASYHVTMSWRDFRVLLDRLEAAHKRESAKAKAALAAPLRNSDVGTAEEQSVRMAEFCRAQYKKTDGVRLCSGCRFFELAGTECQFAWAQMPYEEGGAK